MLSWLYSPPGASPVSVEFWRVNFSFFNIFVVVNNRYTHGPKQSSIWVRDPMVTQPKNYKKGFFDES